MWDINISSSSSDKGGMKTTKEQALSEGWFQENETGLCFCGCGDKSPVARMTSRKKGHLAGEHIKFIQYHNSRGKHNPMKGKSAMSGKLGPDSARWSGGRTDNRGYILIWVTKNHPLRSMASKAGYIREHRLVMAENLGRPLAPEEIVHHKNGIKDDNRIENLEIVTQNLHTKIHNTRRKLADNLLKEFEKRGLDPEEFLSVCGS